MTPRKARELLAIYFGHEAVNAFDPLWPETMLGVAPGVPHDQVLAALRHRLAAIQRHPAATSDEADLLADALRSVAAQMIAGPGAPWSDDLERQLALPAQPGTVARLAPRQHPESPSTHAFLQQARALIAARGISPATIAQLHALAQDQQLPPESVERFLDVLAATDLTPAPPAQTVSAPRTTPLLPSSDKQRLLLIGGALAVLIIMLGAALAIITLSGKTGQSPPAPTSSQPVTPTNPQPTQPTSPQPVRSVPPATKGPPDSRVFANTLKEALSEKLPPAQRDAAILTGIQTLRDWWPRLDPGSRAASVASLSAGALDLSQREQSRAALIAAIRQPPQDPTAPQALWHTAATAGLAATLTRERELSQDVRQAASDALAAITGSALRRAPSTFDEAAAEALAILPASLLTSADQPASITKAQADAWLTALRAALHGGTTQDRARRFENALLDATERLITSKPNASESRPIFDFASALLAQVRYREGDPSRDRVLAWFSDPRLCVTDLHLITAAVATQSAAAGIEPTMVLSPGATQADRDDLRARYAESWSRPTATRSATGLNADWFTAARAALADAAQPTGDAEQLTAAAQLADLNQAAALRWRGLPGAVTPPSPPQIGNATIRFNTAVSGDGQWALQYLAESRTGAARLARIAEFELLAGPGPVDSETLAEAALFATGETRSAAQRAALKRADEPAMVNAVLEALPRVRRNASTGDFLGQFTLAGSLPVTSDRWMIHYRKALIERMLTLVSTLTPVSAADTTTITFAESWSVIAGSTPSPVNEIDGPTRAVEAAAAAYSALVGQVRQQVPAPTALIHPDQLERAHAGRVLVASGLPQAFSAHQVSAVEALAVLVAAERPAAAPLARTVIDELARDRAAVNSVAQQIRLTELAATRLWALRLGEPL